MTNKIIFKKTAKFTRYIILFVMICSFTSFIIIDTIYIKQIPKKKGKFFLENKLPDAVTTPINIFNNFFNRINDTIPVNIIKRDEQNIIRYLIRGTFLITNNSVTFSLSDSLVLNYKKWNMSPTNRIVYSAEGVSVTDFLLSNDSSIISFTNPQGQPGSPIDINIQNFNIRDIYGYFSKDTTSLSGLLDGKITVTEFNKQIPVFTGVASIKGFELMQQPVGTLQLNAQTADDTVHATLGLAENGNDISIRGNFFFNNGPQQMDLLLDIKSLQMSTIQSFLKGDMSAASGSINGLIALKGKLTRPEWKGVLNVDTAGFTLAKLGSSYNIEKQKITFDYPAINFNRFTIKDSLGHPLIINGDLCSGTLKEYDLFLNLKSTDFTLINAPRAIKNQVYGYAGINANVAITGTMAAPAISGNIHLDEKTDLTLVLPEKNSNKDAARTVVQFINTREFTLPKRTAFKSVVEPGNEFKKLLNYELNILADKQAALTIIIDPTTGDELKVKGVTKLNMGIDSGGNMVMAGAYSLDSGYYELNYEFAKKRFNIIRGSTINFGGGPTDAQVNIKAEYIANTSPKDLLGNEVGSVDPKIARTFNQKIPFRIILHLKGSLKNPAISFDIQMPEDGAISSQLRTTIENKLVQVRADVAATNKQVFALLALGRFVGEQSTDFFKGNGGDFSDIARESVSKFLSAALDQIASDLFKGINVDLNLNSLKDFTSNDGTQKTDLNVEVSKNFLNDRLSVTVGKNFGIEGQDGSTKASQQKASRFLPDVIVNYKLSSDGKYMIRSYNKNQFEVIMDGYVVETGLAFIITMDYDQYEKIFNRTNKKADK